MEIRVLHQWEEFMKGYLKKSSITNGNNKSIKLSQTIQQLAENSIT